MFKYFKLRILCYFILYVGLVHTINAQNNYKELGNLTGISIVDLFPEIDKTAENLDALFLEHDFSIYDFSFYTHHRVFTDGVPEVFNKVIADLESPYYILFGREYNAYGGSSKLWVELKLPDDGVFSCLTQNYRKVIENSVELPANTILQNSNSYDYYNAISTSIANLNSFIVKLSNCCLDGQLLENCGCFANLSEIRSYLRSSGYLRFFDNAEITISNKQYQNLESTLDIKVSGPDYYIEYSNHIETIISAINAKGRVSYFGNSNCEDFGEFEPAEFPGYDYIEDVVILDFNGQLEIFSLIGIDPILELKNDELDNAKCPPCAAAAAYAVKELLTRLAMGTMGAVIYVGVEGAVENWVGDHGSFKEGIKHAELLSLRKVLQLVEAFAQGAFADKLYLSAGIGVFSGVRDYLIYEDFDWSNFGSKVMTVVASEVIGAYGGEVIGTVRDAIKRKFIRENSEHLTSLALKELIPIFAMRPHLIANAGELVRAWKRLLDETVDKSIRSNVDALSDPDAVLDAIQISQKTKPTWTEIKVLFKRGNDFNAKGRLVYEYNEINLVDGKRLDSYIPGLEIISRKATTLKDIKLNTYEKYLKELTTKYKKGKVIRSNKYKDGPGAIDGDPLSGDYFLEIPSSNQSYYEASIELQNLSTQYNVQIKYLDE